MFTKIKNIIFEKQEDMDYPLIIQGSYALGQFYAMFLSTILSSWIFKFYETEVFLPIAYITIAVSVYGVWNAINDPFVGYISDLPLSFTKRYGKRLTWFIITAIPGTLMIIFIFSPPNGDDIVIFLWLITSLFLLEFFYSFVVINWQAVFPSKFRSQKERSQIGGLSQFFFLGGFVFGYLIPIIVITNGPNGTNKDSYMLLGLITIVLGIGSIILMLPGMYENKELRKNNAQVSSVQEERSPFIKTLIFALKQKNFRAYLIGYLAQNIMFTILISSLPYYVDYILHADTATFILLGAFFGFSNLFSIPFWMVIARKYGNRIGYMCGTAFVSIFLIFGIFVSNIISIIITLICVGFSFGAFQMSQPAFSDVLDEILLKTGKREEALYYGFRTFFSRFSIVIMSITFFIVHTVTHFDPVSDTQTPLAQWGIIIGMMLIPAIVLIFAFIVMWKIYDLTPERVENNKESLEKLNL